MDRLEEIIKREGFFQRAAPRWQLGDRGQALGIRAWSVCPGLRGSCSSKSAAGSLREFVDLWDASSHRGSSRSGCREGLHGAQMSDRFSVEIFDTDWQIRQVFIEIIVKCFFLKGYREVTAVSRYCSSRSISVLQSPSETSIYANYTFRPQRLAPACHFQHTGRVRERDRVCVCVHVCVWACLLAPMGSSTFTASDLLKLSAACCLPDGHQTWQMCVHIKAGAGEGFVRWVNVLVLLLRLQASWGGQMRGIHEAELLRNVVFYIRSSPVLSQTQPSPRVSEENTSTISISVILKINTKMYKSLS